MGKIKTFFKMLKSVENNATYMGDYFGLISKEEITLKLRNGVRYKIRAGSTDRFIINEIWLHKSYNPEGFEIKEDDIVVDIGGHIGIFSVMAAHYAKKGKVYAFEPVKENYELLKKNVVLNGLRNVFVMNKAVSDKSGKMELFISGNKNKGQSSAFKVADNQEKRVVEKYSFKEFLRKVSKVDFLKVDCEGGEYEILLNLNNRELQKIKKIAMEYHNYEGRNGLEIKDFLEQNGFQVKMEGSKMFGTIYARLIE